MCGLHSIGAIFFFCFYFLDLCYYLLYVCVFFRLLLYLFFLCLFLCAKRWEHGHVIVHGSLSSSGGKSM